MLKNEAEKHYEVVNNAEKSDKDALLQVVRELFERLGDKYVVD